MTEDKNIQSTDEDEDVEGHRLGASSSRLGASSSRLGASSSRLGASSSRIGETLQHSDEDEDDVEGHSFTRERLTNVTDRLNASE